jgi:hypothetical protein
MGNLPKLCGLTPAIDRGTPHIAWVRLRVVSVVEHRRHTNERGLDLPDVRDWKWSSPNEQTTNQDIEHERQD